MLQVLPQIPPLDQFPAILNTFELPKVAVISQMNGKRLSLANVQTPFLSVYALYLQLVNQLAECQPSWMLSLETDVRIAQSDWQGRGRQALTETYRRDTALNVTARGGCIRNKRCGRRSGS